MNAPRITSRVNKKVIDWLKAARRETGNTISKTVFIKLLKLISIEESE